MSPAPGRIARPAPAYLASAFVHAGFLAFLLVLAYGIGSNQPGQPKVFELVAGAGDNYGATVAPALGVPGGIKLRLSTPRPSAAVETAMPAEPVPPPVQAAKPAPRKTAAPKKPDTVANFTKVLERTEKRRAARLEAKYRKQLEEQEKKEEREEARERKAAAGAAKTERIDAEGIREGVVGGSTENKTGGAGGKALSREEGDLLDGYFALLKARIKENFQGPDDAGNRLTARLEFFVAADGSLSDGRIARSSGSADFDQSVLEAFHRTSSIGPRPDGKGESVTMEFDLREDDQN
jgi:colicin import membrane protein